MLICCLFLYFVVGASSFASLKCWDKLVHHWASIELSTLTFYFYFDFQIYRFPYLLFFRFYFCFQFLLLHFNFCFHFLLPHLTFTASVCFHFRFLLPSRLIFTFIFYPYLLYLTFLPLICSLTFTLTLHFYNAGQISLLLVTCCVSFFLDTRC